jgi:hypothetical protein
MPDDNIFEQSLLQRLARGEEVEDNTFDIKNRVSNYEQNISTQTPKPNQDLSKLLQERAERAGRPPSKKQSDVYSYEDRVDFSGNPTDRVHFWESERSLMEQLGRGSAMFGEGIVDQALLGAPSTFTDWEDIAPDPETGLERFMQMSGETIGFILPFMATKGRTSAAAQSSKAGAKTGLKQLETSVDAAISKKNLKFDSKLYKTADDAKDFIVKQATALTVGNKLSNFARMSAVQKTKFSRDMQHNTGKMIKEFVAKQGIRGIDDEAVKLISKDMGTWWTSIDGRVVSSLEDLMTNNLMKRNLFANWDTTGKYAAYMGGMMEEAALFAMVEGMALGVQDLSSADWWGYKPKALDGENKVPIGIMDYLKTGIHASVFGAALGWTRAAIPGGVRGGVFKQMKGSNLDNINSMLNGPGTNFAKGIKTTTKEGRQSLNHMHRAYGQIDDLILKDKELGTVGIPTVLGKKARNHPSFKKLPEKFRNKELFLPEDLAKLASDETLTRAQKIAIAEIQQDGLQHLAKRVRTDMRVAFAKTMKADWFGGTVNGERIMGSFPRVLAGGTLFGVQGWIDPNVPMDDKIFHTMLGMAFLKGGRDLQFKGRDVSLDRMTNRWNSKSSGLFGRTSADFPKNLEILSEINSTTGVDVGNRGVWGPIFNRIEQDRIDFWDQVQPVGGVNEKTSTFHKKVLEKDKKGNYKYLVKEKFDTDGNDITFKGDTDLKLKGPRDQFIPNYIYWSRNVQSAFNKEGNKIIPEGYRVKDITMQELKSSEARGMEKMFKELDVFNSFDMWRYLTKSGGLHIKKGVDMMVSDMIKTDFLIRPDGKKYSLVGQTNDGFTKLSPIDSSRLDLSKMSDAHKENQLHIEQALDTWNRVVDLNHRNSDMPFSQIGQPIKIDNRTSGLIEWANHIQSSQERFSDRLKPMGFKKIIKIDNFLEAQYDIFNDFNSVDKSISVLKKLYETKQDKLEPSEKRILDKINDAIKTEKDGKITDLVLVSDSPTSNINKKQSLFINSIRDAARNIPGQKSVRPNVTERPTLEQMKRLEEGKDIKKISNKDINEIMEFFHREGVTIWSNGYKKMKQLEDFTETVVKFQAHESLKKSEFPVLDAEGKVIGKTPFSLKHFNVIQILKEQGIVDSFLGVTKDVQLFGESLTSFNKRQKNLNFDKMFEEIDKKGLADYKKSLEDANLSQVEINNRLKIYESFKDMAENPKTIDMKMQEINALIDNLTNKYRPELGSYTGVLSPHTRQTQILIPSNQAQLLYIKLSEVLTQEKYGKEQIFHKKLFDMDSNRPNDQRHSAIMKMITADLMTSRESSVKQFDAAVLSKLYDVTKNEFAWNKDRYVDKLEPGDLMMALKSELKKFNSIMENGWDYSKRQIKERYENFEQLDMTKDSELMSQSWTVDHLLEYNLGEWTSLEEGVSKRKYLHNNIFIKEFYGDVAKFNLKFKEQLELHNSEFRDNPNLTQSVLMKVSTDLVNSKDRPIIEIDLKDKARTTREDISVTQSIRDGIIEKLISDPAQQAFGIKNKIIYVKSTLKNREGKEASLFDKDMYIDAADAAYNGELPYMPKNPKDMVSEYQGRDVERPSDLKIETTGQGEVLPRLMFYLRHPNSMKGKIDSFKLNDSLVDTVLNTYLKTLYKDGQKEMADKFIADNNVKNEQRIDPVTEEIVTIKDSWTFGGKNQSPLFSDFNVFPIEPTLGRQLFRDMLYTLELREIKKEKGLDNFYKELSQDPELHALEQTRIKIVDNSNSVRLDKPLLKKHYEFMSESKVEFEGKKDILEMNQRATNSHPEGRTIKKVVIRDENLNGKVAEIVSVQNRLIKGLEKLINNPETNIYSKKIYERELENIKDLYKNQGYGEVSAGDSYMMVTKKFHDFMDYTRFGREPGTSKSGGIKAHYADIKNPKLFGLYKTFLQKHKMMEKIVEGTDVEVVVFNTASKKMGQNYHKEMAEKFISLDNFTSENFNLNSLKEKIKDKNTHIPVDIEGFSIMYRKGNKTDVPAPANQSLHFDMLTSSKELGDSNVMNQFIRDIYGKKLETANENARRIGKTQYMNEQIAKLKQLVNRKSIHNAESMEGFVLGEGDMKVAKLLTMFDAPPQLGGVTMTELLLKDIFSESLNPKVSGSHAVFAPDIRFKKDGTLENPLKIPIVDKDTGEHFQLGEIIVPHDFRTRQTNIDKITIEIPKKGENNIIVNGSEASKHGITLRENGTMYDYAKNGQQTPLYQVKVDMYEHQGRRSKDGDPADIWVVKDLKEANEQLQAMKEGPGGAVNFANKIVKNKNIESGEYILRDNKADRGDHKYIYIKGSKAHKELLKEEIIVPDTNGNLTVRQQALQKDPKKVKGKQYIKGAEIPYNVVLFARRDPYYKEGSVVPVALKDFNERDNGNQFILNDKDAFHHVETDMDGDTASISHSYSKEVSKEFMKIASQAMATQVRPTNGNAAYETLTSGPYNPMKEISQLEYSEVQARAARLRGSVMQVSHIAHWFLNNNSRNDLRILNEKGDAVFYEGPMFPISGTDKGIQLFLGIRQEVRDKQGASRFRQELAKDIQTLVDTAKGEWDTEYFSSARDITNRLLFHKDYGLFVPMKRQKRKDGKYKDELVWIEQPNIDFRRDHVTAFQAIEKLWMIKKDSLKFRNNELNADGSMRKPKFKDRKATMDRYGEELSSFEWSEEANALRNEMGWSQSQQILRGFGDNANFMRNKNGTSNMGMIDRIDYSMHSGINHGWKWKNTDTDITSLVESTIDKFTATRERGENNKYLSDAEHYNKIIEAFNKETKEVGAKFYMLETLQNQVAELRNERKGLTGNDASSAAKLTAQIEAKKVLIENMKKIELKEYLDVDSYFTDKAKLKPKVKQFLDSVFNDYKIREERILKEEKGDNFSVLDADAKSKIEARAKASMEKNGINIEQVSRGDVLEAMAAERAFGNLAESTPGLLKVNAETHKELINIIDNLKKDYSEAMLKEYKPKESSGFINDNYIVDIYREQLLGILRADKYQNPALQELVFRRLMSPEIQANKIGSYRGNLYFMPKYTNFHKFVKLGMQTSMEFHQGIPSRLEPLWKPFFNNYKRQVLAMQNGIAGEGTLKDGKMTPENWRVEHLTMGTRYNKLRLLEELIPEADNIFGKRITELDNYTIDSIIFNGGFIPEIINNNRITNLPWKAVTDISAEYGRDSAIYGKKESDIAIDQNNARAFYIDKDRNSFIRDLQTNNTLKSNETSQNLTQERSVDVERSLEEYERKSQEETEQPKEGILCSVTEVIKGD